MRRRLLILLAGALAAAALPAQEEPRAAGEPAGAEVAPAGEAPGDELEPLPPEPTTPREELFLAIELKDADAARRALRGGAEAEISMGNPSPLGTAALHDDLRMVTLLLDFGGDPSATGDSPLEEAIRNENPRIVELFLRAGARVPPGNPGRELFRLAQRGPAAVLLSKILLDSGANPDLCLAAATADARGELIRYCIERGGDVGSLPPERNVLSVALRLGDPELVDLVVAEGLEDRVVAGALDAAVAAGDMDVTRLALAAGAVPAFAQVEAAIENGHPEIAQFLLDQSPPEDAAMLAGGDVAALIQRTEDLGLAELAAALRRKSGRAAWSVAKALPLVLLGLALAVLAALAVRGFRRRQGVAISVPPGFGAGPAKPGQRRSASASAAPPAAAARPAAAAPTARPAAAVAAARPAPAAAPPVPATAPVEASREAWKPAPKASTDEPAAAPAVPSAGPAAAPAADVELRMPEVDLGRDAEAVFRAARQAASGEAVRPDATDRRHLVLVTPARATLLRPCPAPGSLSAEEVAAAAAFAPAGEPKNVAVIAYNEVDAVRGDVATAIPFFELLTRLGYLGHAVWIFEGHVSAMAAGCRDADVLIVDDGMSRYLPGNWRSAASRVMRGREVYVFERATGALRRL